MACPPKYPSHAALFVYGTLRDRDVLQIVLGREVHDGVFSHAVLEDHRLVRVPDESYFQLMAYPGDTVSGNLILELTSEDWARISFFESEEYQYAEYTVHRAGVGPVRALACAEGEVLPGASELWGLEDWQAVHKSRFLQMIRRFMDVYGPGTLEEAEAIWAEFDAGIGRD